MFKLPTADPFEVDNFPSPLKRIVWISTGTISLWLLFYPKPYLFILGVTYVAVLVLLIFALFLPNGTNKEGTLYNNWNDIRFYLLGPIGLISCFLAMRIASDNQITQNFHYFSVNLVASFVVTVIFYLIFKKGIVSCFFVSILLSAGLVITINGLLLPDSMNIRKGILIKKHIGYKQSPHFNISSQSQIIILRVSQSTYAQTDIGMNVCFIMQNGLLGIEIKDVIDCSVKKNND